MISPIFVSSWRETSLWAHYAQRDDGQWFERHQEHMPCVVGKRRWTSWRRREAPDLSQLRRTKRVARLPKSKVSS